MIKKLLVSTAVAAMIATASPVLAQSTATSNQEAFVAAQTTDQTRASQWIGVKVTNSADETIGDVNDLVIDANNEIVALVVGVGGFLGIAEKNVALPISSIEKTVVKEDELAVKVALTKEQLEAAPTFKMIGVKTLRERAADLSKAAGKAYNDAKDSIEKNYEKAKDAVTKEDKPAESKAQ